MRKAKNDWINERCTEIDTCMKGNNTRQAYSILKALTKKGQADRQTSKTKTATSLPKKAVHERWTEYTDDNILGTPPQNENADTSILRAEVEWAIRMLKT